MDVDQEIDELISDSPPRKPIPTPQDDTPDSTCRWNSCDKPFDDPKALGQHLAAEHIPEKRPFTCEWDGCGRKGHEQNSKFQLNTHIRSHTGEKPFVCTRPDCDRAFVRNDALQKHLKQHETSEALDVPMPAPKKTKPKGKAKAEPTAAPPLTTTSSRSFDSPHPNPKSHDGARDAHPSGSSGHAEGRPGPSSLRHVSETFAPTLNFDWTEARSAGLYEDIDLSDVMTSVHASAPFWTISQRDVEALETIRRMYPQHPHPGPDEAESEDEFDEGVSRNYPAIPETVAVAEEGHTEVRVLSRPRWQVKYVMAKAKLMLVEEENRMRRVQLRDWMEREEAMLQGKELRDLGPAGEAFAEIVREDVQREMEKAAGLVNGSGSNGNGDARLPGDPYEAEI